MACLLRGALKGVAAAQTWGGREWGVMKVS